MSVFCVELKMCSVLNPIAPYSVWSWAPKITRQSLKQKLRRLVPDKLRLQMLAHACC